MVQWKLQKDVHQTDENQKISPEDSSIKGGGLLSRLVGECHHFSNFYGGFIGCKTGS
ncbi:MAG: hypothetical protein R3E32_13040 [Chitinophagales bacterium]